MAVCIRRLGPEAHKLKLVSEKAYEKVQRFVHIHITLMSFFLIGYLTVGVSLLFDVRFIGELFVGTIFFFGAVFVLLGILLQSKMTASLKTHYDQAVDAKKAIETERKRLSRLNECLEAEIIERRQAERALIESKTFLQNIIDSLPEQIMVINRDYSIALANRPALDAIGMETPTEIMRCHEISHGSEVPCAGDAYPCPIAEILRTGKKVTTEHIHNDTSGNSTIVEIVATPIFDNSGKIIQIVESCRDITIRRQAEGQLRESEKKYRTILESIEDGYFETRLDGTISFVNPSMCAIMEYEKEQLIGMTNRDLASADTAKMMFQQFQAVYKTGEPCPITKYELVTGSGKMRLLELTAALMHDKQGQPSGFRGIVRDVTDLAAAQKALQESEERYRKLSEVTMEGICFNDNSVIIDANDTFARMFGYRRSELIGVDASQHLISQEWRKNVSQVVQSKSNEIYEAVGVRKDGTRFPLEIEGRGVRYRGKSVRVACVRDITERKRTEQRITMMQKMQAIGTLAGGIAHDFNNILASIMGYTEICRMKIPPESPISSHLQSILKASHRARELVSQILSFSRSEEEVVRPVQVSLIIKETLKLLRPSIPATIDIKSEIDSDTGQIQADSTQIHQIIMNLSTNAAHAMRTSGGTMTIGLRNCDLEEPASGRMVEISPGAYICLTVSDTGKGMDAETLKRVFEPYFTTKEKGEGTGLGLFVVHGIVQRFNGWLDVESKPGQGTTFSIFFPRIEAETEVETPDVEEYPNGTETIMVIDDDENLVAMTAEMLGSLGYRVTPATSPSDALELFRTVPESFSLIITDQTMPGMTGEALAAQMRSIKPGVPVIICTGYSETMNSDKAKACGIDGFLMKPVKMNELARLVRRVIDSNPSSTNCQ